MKKLTALIICIIMAIGFSSCNKADGGIEAESGSLVFENAEKAYEEMTNAAATGDFAKAVECYKAGAADTEDADVMNWYFYSLAMAEYTENGCVGYPLTILEYNINGDFAPAKTASNELMMKVRDFNGIYEFEGSYLYIIDGKIGIGVGQHLTGTVFCNAEVAIKDGKAYYAERKADGSHILLYSIERDNNTIVMTALESNTQDMYSGTYSVSPAEYPELIY